MKKYSMLTVVMVMFAFMATSAVAQDLGQLDSATYGTQVNIEVAEEVSMWAADNIDLTLEGKNAENSDAAASSVGHINNVAAQISVAAEEYQSGDNATLKDVNFFIFYHFLL